MNEHDDARAFFRRLSPQAQEEASIPYRFAELRRPEAVAVQRVAQSDHYRSDAFECRAFHKPISRCFPPVEEPA